MGKETALKARLFQSVIHYVRTNNKDDIDSAYSFFFDEHTPDEFMTKTALEISFINFEDWLIADYRLNDQKETVIDLYVKCTRDLSSEERAVLKKIRNSILSLYEVVSVSEGKGITVKDLLLEGEYNLDDNLLTHGLKTNDIFASRLLELDDKTVMSSCVYPFSASDKDRVHGHIHKEFKRYKKNIDPDGTMKDYLKNYGDVFNLIWMHIIIGQSQGRS